MSAPSFEGTREERGNAATGPHTLCRTMDNEDTPQPPPPPPPTPTPNANREAPAWHGVVAVVVIGLVIFGAFKACGVLLKDPCEEAYGDGWMRMEENAWNGNPAHCTNPASGTDAPLPD